MDRLDRSRCGWRDLEYSAQPARYAKGKIALQVPGIDGWVYPGGTLCPDCGRRQISGNDHFGNCPRAREVHPMTLFACLLLNAASLAVTLTLFAQIHAVLPLLHDEDEP